MHSSWSQSAPGSSSSTSPSKASLALTLRSAAVRRLHWALAELKASAEAAGAAGARRSAAEAMSRRVAQLEHSVEEGQQEAQAQRESWHSELAGLQAYAQTVAAAHGAACLQLKDARVEEGFLAAHLAQAEGQLARQGADERAEAARERRAREELRGQLQELWDGYRRSEQQSEASAARCAECVELLRRSEHSCAQLEARLARKAQWRDEAQWQISQMVERGEGLEHERAQLRRELTVAQQHCRVQADQVGSLLSAYEQEEQLAEIMRARVCALEQDNAELAERVAEQRAARAEDAEEHGKEVAAVEGERARAFAVLAEARRDGEAAEARGADCARARLEAAWGRERAQWSLSHAGLERRIDTLQQELQSAR
ncbi:unnamed protein product, partial [Prorocentrum cordatum]